MIIHAALRATALFCKPISFLCVLVMTMPIVSPFAPQRAYAQEGVATDVGTSSEGDWRFRLAPYVWIPAMKGDVGIRNIEADVDISQGDIIDNMDGGALLAFEARYKRFSSTTDFLWMGLEDSQATPRGVLFSSANAEVDEISWTQMFGYQVVESKEMPIDLLGGFRLVSISSDLTLKGGQLPSQKVSMDETWIDPVIGARTLISLSDPIYLRIYGDIGGFGAASSLTWQTLMAFDWKVSNSTAISGGYRALGYDYDRSDFMYDVITHGPIVGVNVSF